jgi:hypothetical protein
MLVQYETAVQQLIQSVPSGLIPTPTLDSYINKARMQLAGDAECIRAPANLTFTAGTQAYAVAAMVPNAAQVSGVATAFTVRSGFAAGAIVPLEFRSFEWFAAYYLTSAVRGTPAVVAQRGQGTLGILYFYPIPDGVSPTAQFDVCCLPVPLVNDATPEAIPGLWTDAVPFYAAWLAMMQLQRQADAHIMLTRYQELALRGRQESTPSELPDNLPGGPGARMAAIKTTLTSAPQQQQPGGR